MGILKTAATVAVASSVHGRIQRRQQNRWAAQDTAAAPAAAPPPAAPQAMAPQAPALPLPPAPPADMTERLAQLAQLGDLKSAGILTEAEFEQQKARILNA